MNTGISKPYRTMLGTEIDGHYSNSHLEKNAVMVVLGVCWGCGETGALSLSSSVLDQHNKPVDSGIISKLARSNLSTTRHPHRYSLSDASLTEEKKNI